MKSWVLSAAGLGRSSYYYKAVSDDKRRANRGRPVPGYTVNRDGTIILDSAVVDMLKKYRDQPEYVNAAGVRKLKYMLRRDFGIDLNEKKIYRICLEKGLLLNRRNCKKTGFRKIAANREVSGPNQVWQFDIKYGYVDGEGKFFFVLAFIDTYLREVVGNHVGLSCKAGDLSFVLSEALKAQGIGSDDGLIIRSDNGPQMTSKAFAGQLKRLEIELMHEFIPPKTPNKNAHIESFFSILENEFLSVRYFTSFEEAYRETKKFINHYNTVRIHGSLGYITPAEARDHLERGGLLNIQTITM